MDGKCAVMSPVAGSHRLTPVPQRYKKMKEKHGIPTTAHQQQHKTSPGVSGECEFSSLRPFIEIVTG